MRIVAAKSIEAYFQADRDGRPEAVAAVFTDDGVVQDEGKTYRGHAAIRQWKAGTTQKYTHTVEPFFVSSEDEQTLVTCHVVGDFPGSPVDLRFFFVLAGDRIARLEVTV